jgi:protein-S-isoprenylcysteine O-methyltransferase Ste14
VIALVGYLPGLCFWLLIHPLVHAWRRVGPAIAYAIVLSILTALGTIVFRSRDALLGRDFGTNGVLFAVGVGCFAAQIWWWLAVARHAAHLDAFTRGGLPELRGVTQPGALVRDGIYRVVRHPIYLGGLVAGVAYALMANYLGVYVLAVLAIPVVYVITLLEERELTDRFGDAYRQYQREVPRLVPRGGISVP